MGTGHWRIDIQTSQAQEQHGQGWQQCREGLCPAWMLGYVVRGVALRVPERRMGMGSGTEAFPQFLEHTKLVRLSKPLPRLCPLLGTSSLYIFTAVSSSSFSSSVARAKIEPWD